MTMAVIQTLALAVLVAYLGHLTLVLRRHNAESWNSLVARLRPGWDARELIDESFGDGQRGGTLYWKVKRICGAHGLWAMFKNAGVMLEMADYAARYGDGVDRELLESIGKDARQTRVLVLEVLARFAFGAVNESIVMNMLRAESAYAEMTLRITTLLEANAPEALPAFIGSM